ncbi:hypothetical protein KAR91_34995, partial [Candidatus Pacearchaeota archaeon]|nr:hypothetical protein [Candidatus Pacearchaeota archaeon]
MMPDSKEKWQIKIKSDFSETDNNNYLFYICKNEYWVSLEESAKLDSSQEDLIYQFTEIITRDNSFLEYLLKRAIPSALESPYDLAVQFLERLREILEGGTNRQEKTRLLFELIAIEGRFSHTENRILNLFRTAVGMQAVKSLSLKVEKKVLRIATTKEGLFKAAVSDQIIKEVVLWLTQRGAVDRLRLLFRPLPFVFRYDPIRAFFLFVIFLGGLALITHYGGSLEGFTALIVSIFAGIIVMWILLAPVRMTQTSRWAVGLRPAFMFRWHSLICWVLIALTGSV